MFVSRFSRMMVSILLLCLSVPIFAITISLQSAYPKKLLYLGTLPYQLSELVAKMSGGEIIIQVHEPGKKVDTLNLEAEVSKGTIDAAFSGLGYVTHTRPVVELFTSVPFGPPPLEYAGWMYYGGGLHLLRRYLRKENVMVIPGMLLPTEASGWYKEPINKPADLKGKRIRIYGLGRPIFQELGAKTVMLPGDKIYEALRTDQLDGGEFSSPSVDRALKLYQVANYYYFPGWHQPATFLFIYINNKVWRKIPAKDKAIISNACMSLVFSNYIKMESAQKEAIEALRTKTNIRIWSPQMLRAFHKAWLKVIDKNSQKDPDFRKVLNSIQHYRTQYEYWNHLNQSLLAKDVFEKPHFKAILPSSF